MSTVGEGEMRWLAVRRDHDGNLDVMLMPDGSGPAWELTEGQARGVLQDVECRQRKVHGQSYWTLSYPVGGLAAFLQKSAIRY